MGQWFEVIKEEHAEWIKKQKIFFVATAPLDGRGCVNSSPKGHDCLRVLGPNQVCYLELTGSGIETQSHLEENGRITIMLTAFEGGPRIMRLIGTGRVVRYDSPEFNQLLESHYKGSDIYESKGKRGIIMVDVRKVGTSCGYAVPYFEYLGQRDALVKAWTKKGDETRPEYWATKNKYSLDGLPGMRHEMLGPELTGTNRGPEPVELPEWAIIGANPRKKGFSSWLKAGLGLSEISILSIGIAIGLGIGSVALKRR